MSGVLVYDGSCRFCASSVSWLDRHAHPTAQVVDWQHADLGTLGLTPEECTDTVQWVEDGHRAVGPDAFAAYLQTSTSPWRAAGRVLGAPVPRQVARPVYRWLSHHRDRLPAPATPATGPRQRRVVTGVRRRRPKDIGACSRLLRVVHGEDGYPARWVEPPRAWLEADDVLDAWVVERQGELLGHVAISTVGEGEVSAFRWREMTGQDPAQLAGVTRLFVRPRVRGQGIGKALLDVATAEILTRGLSPVADVVAASRETMRLYEDHGWTLLAMDPWRERPEELRVWCYRLPAPHH